MGKDGGGRHGQLGRERLWVIAKRVVSFTAFLAFFMWILYALTGSACVFEATIGLPCPGCGMTRAWLAALHGHWHEAASWHPLFWLAPVFGGLWLLQSLRRGGKPSRWFGGFAAACGLALVAVYIARFILMFPHTAPLTPNPDALAWRLFYFLRDLFG